MLFDTHAHMDDRAFDTDRAELLNGLPGKGIGLLMNPGCSLESSRNAVALAAQYDYIYAAEAPIPTWPTRSTKGIWRNIGSYVN